MPKVSVGLTSLKVGAIAVDGGMGTSLDAIGYTVRDTCVLNTEEGTNTDFNIEEQDDPIYTIVSEKGATTLAWSCYDVDVDTLVKLLGGTKVTLSGLISTLGTITGGSSYTNGTYNNVPLTGGTGTGATANITVAGGAVTGVVIVNKGSGYANANSLSATAANIGGTGTGFTVPVTAITSQDTWQAPAVVPEIEVSIEIVPKNGGKVEIPRAKLTSLLQWNFQKTALAQINITARVLVPTKANTPPMIWYEN